MKNLGEFATTASRTSGRFIARLIGDSNELVLCADVEVASYKLDDSPWPAEEKRCDALLVVSEPALTIFVEFKGTIDDDKNAKAEQQLKAGMEHFAPTTARNTHGDQHHEQWRSGADLPTFQAGRKASLFSISADHGVFGIIVARGVGTRTYPPTELSIGERTVPVVRVSSHSSSEDKPMQLHALLGQMGIAEPSPATPPPTPTAPSQRSRKRRR